MGIVLLTRPDAAVLSGRVVEINDLGDNRTSVILRNGISDEAEDLATVQVVYKTDFVRKMRLGRGSLIMTTTNSQSAFDVLMDGGRVGNMKFKARGYSLRYSGEYTFEEKNGFLEKHVLFGKVMRSEDRDGFDIMFRSGAENVVRRLHWKGEIPSEGKRVFCITSGKTEYHNGQPCNTVEKLIINNN